MTITEKQRSVIRAAAAFAAIAVVWTSGFSVSAKTISDEDSKNTETQVSDGLLVLPNGDALVSDENGDIDIMNGITVNIKVGASAYKKYEVPQTTVGEALEHANIALGKYDLVSKSLDEEVEENSNIEVDRVSFKKTVKTQKIKYKTVFKNTTKLYEGEKKTLKKGKKGKKKVTYTSKLVNGEVKKTYVTNTKVTKKAKKKVVLVGTKRKNYTMLENNPTQFNTKSRGGIGTITDHNGKKIAYKKVVKGPATAYSAHPGALTATGAAVRVGGVAVNPAVIPYGSKLYIESPDGSMVYGYATAIDTGGFIHTSSTVVDLFYTSNSTCCTWGRRPVNIYVLA
ncbi:MAG: G5 domain-containing protein [Ruminococcus sp.]|nr:G5 domain-containing protein [Ruminococcus sp.]